MVKNIEDDIYKVLLESGEMTGCEKRAYRAENHAYCYVARIMFQQTQDPHSR